MVSNALYLSKQTNYNYVPGGGNWDSETLTCLINVSNTDLVTGLGLEQTLLPSNAYITNLVLILW